RVHAEFLRPRPGRGGVDVGTGDQLQVPEGRDQPEIGARYVAAAYDADSVFLAHDGQSSECLDGRDRARGEPGDVPGIVVLDDEVFDGRAGERLGEIAPRQHAVADIRPAVLLRILALRRDVLDMHGGDAVAVFPDPGEA